MNHYTKTIVDSFSGYWNYLVHDISEPSWHSYFYALIAVSILIYALELLFPWRRQQPLIRRDFWIDGFYMFFNFFIFSLIGYNALSNVGVQAFADLYTRLGLADIVIVHVEQWPIWLQLVVLFIVRDFIGYWTHRLLHRSPYLWRFHQVHHSVVQMGFSAHLRFHPMETIIYRTIEYIPLAMIGFGIREFFFVNMIALTIGHLNHSNIHLPLGPLRYILNCPQMHLWHHAKEIPNPYGINYGISLSLWDWLFGTAHWPYSDKNIPLGFVSIDTYPKHFWQHMIKPFRR